MLGHLAPLRPRFRTVGTFLVGVVVGPLLLTMTGVLGTGHDVAGPADPLALSAGRNPSMAATGPSTTFNIATLNVLGDGHTAKGGDRRGWSPGVTRQKWLDAAIVRKHVDVVGLQEFQEPQYDEFAAQLGSTYSMWPGDSQGRGFLRNSIAWRTAEWTLVRTSWIKLPYFHGAPLRMPVVLLQNKQTSQQAYFMNFQNPANARGPAEKWRARGRALQSALVNRLKAQSGLPVFWTGDFNDRDLAFCDVTARTGMIAASGGSHVGSQCSPHRPEVVDWIFGTPDVTFSHYLSDRSGNIAKATDHHMVTATATIPPTLAPVCTSPTPTPTPTPTPSDTASTEPTSSPTSRG